MLKRRKIRESPFTIYLKNPFSILTIILRLATAIWILFDPFYGTLIYMLGDTFDSTLLFYGAKFTFHQYHQLDKLLDWTGYLAMMFVAMRYEIYPLLFLVFIYRLFGQLVFLFVKSDKVFLFFANFIEFTFFYQVVLNKLGVQFSFKNNYEIIILGCIWIFQLFREYTLHFWWPKFWKKNGNPRFVRSIGFDIKRKDFWDS